MGNEGKENEKMVRNNKSDKVRENMRETGR